MTLEWLPPVKPAMPGLKPHLMRSACLRYRIDKSWPRTGQRYFAWAITTTDPERIGEFTKLDAAKTACAAHLLQTGGKHRDAA